MTAVQRPDDWDLPVAIPELGEITTVLVAFDGSHTAERALAWGSLIASSTGAAIVVMVAYEAPLTKRGRGALYVDALREELRQEAVDLAGEAAALLAGRGHETRAVVVRGDPAAAVRETITTESCDLVVLGRQGLGSETSPGALRLSGRMVDHLVGRAECSVLVVD